MIKEMQINATLRHRLWSIRLAKTKKNGNARQAKTRGTNTLITWGWAGKLEQPFQGQLGTCVKSC